MQLRHLLLYVNLLLVSCGEQPTPTGLDSLTGKAYQGKKYYFGFGQFLHGFMGNETKYDVLHTHDIFTSHAGGEYRGIKLIEQNFGRQNIIASWNSIRSQMKPEDMYVQYSSGHGSEDGLEVGVSYNEIRDHVLAMPAREIIIFTMACHSGGLVKAFEQRRSEWQDWARAGRTLVVVSSSLQSENSSTGPGFDPSEHGANGSAGSAFGHALWKALSGDADGYVDGVKDGFLSLEEIIDFTKAKTFAIGRHTPQVIGTFSPHLIMNQVPSRQNLMNIQKATDRDLGGKS